jgi:hypothetical protein
MLHLALATNILTAAGAAPHFERPNLPILSRWYPPGVQIALLPFGERALRHFMYLERPEGMTLKDAQGFAAQPDIQPVTSIDRPVVAVPEEWRTVGHLYRGIEAGLARLCGRYGEDAVFIGPPGAQAVTATFEWKELTAVTGLASASRAIIAAAGLAAHQLTGSPIPDAAGSILVGALLAVVAIILINRNRRFLVGEEADPRVRAATIAALLDAPEVARVTYLRLEIGGPRMVSVIGDVDLTGDDTESHLAVRLRALEARISASPAVAGAVLSLSAPDEPTLVV